MYSQRIWLTFILVALISVGSVVTGEIAKNAINKETTRNIQTVANSSGKDVTSVKDRPITVIASSSAENYRTRLILLGSTGGLSWWPGSNRTSSSSALVVGNTIYLIDLGQGSTYRLAQAFNTGNFVNSPGGKIEDGSSTFLKNVIALFFTHLHQDHTADYPTLLLIGPGAGLGTYTDPLTNKTITTPLKVFGPSNRGQLEADKTSFTKKGGQVIYTDSANPENITPTPGTRQMTNLIWQAFAQTINDVTLDDGYPDFRSLVEVKEIGGTEPGDIPLPVSVLDPNNGTCPAMEPFEVYKDNLVHVTATLVDHHQVFQSFAYRFDTEDGSIVFSGDTGPDTNGNLERLANGADILVHEVIDKAWIDQKFGTPKPGSQMDALKTHMLESHTSIEDVGAVAEACRVRTLVLNHIVPGNTPISHLLEAKRNFSGNLIVSEDLMQIGIGRVN